MQHLSRRTFMQTAAACAAAASGVTAASAAPASDRITLGICSGPGSAAKLKAVGFEFLEGSVGGSLKPDKTDEEYAPELERIKTCGLPMISCNGFFSGQFRLTGPEEGLRHDAAIKFAVTACERADKIGLTGIVLGSGGARNAPEGFDIDKAREQFIAFCKKLGSAIADRKVVIMLEPLNKKESNFLNTVSEGIEMVDAINHPRIKLLADIYHMMKDGEQPDSIRKAGARILHCHVAELEGRQFPGNKGEDLRPYYRALRDIGYKGGISCECGWPKENVEEAWQKALAILREQVFG